MEQMEPLGATQKIAQIGLSVFSGLFSVLPGCPIFYCKLFSILLGLHKYAWIPSVWSNTIACPSLSGVTCAITKLGNNVWIEGSFDCYWWFSIWMGFCWVTIYSLRLQLWTDNRLAGDFAGACASWSLISRCISASFLCILGWAPRFDSNWNCPFALCLLSFHSA